METSRPWKADLDRLDYRPG